MHPQILRKSLKIEYDDPTQLFENRSLDSKSSDLPTIVGALKPVGGILFNLFNFVAH